MFMLTLDSPEVLDHLYPKMTTKRATGQVESTLYICTLFSAADQKGARGSESANALQAGSLHLHSFTHSLAPSFSPIHSTLQIARHIVSLPVLNEMTQSGRRREAEGDEGGKG